MTPRAHWEGRAWRKLSQSHFEYAAVEAALAVALGIDAKDQKSAFRARLKHLARLGLPGIEVGKGSRVDYDYDLIGRMLVTLLLIEVGIEPNIAVTEIKRRETEPYLMFWLRRATSADAIKDNPLILHVHPKLMEKRWDWGQKRGLLPQRIEIRPLGDTHELPANTWWCQRNLTAAMAALEEALLPKGRAS